VNNIRVNLLENFPEPKKQSWQIDRVDRPLAPTPGYYVDILWERALFYRRPTPLQPKVIDCMVTLS
jgi:hypothetical protein